MEAEATGARKRRRSITHYLSYDDSQTFAQSLKICSRKEWRAYVKGGLSEYIPKPDNVPAHPDGIYKTRGWQGWRKWLGTDIPPYLN